MMKKLSVSVRKLVEFVMMGGSIDSRFTGSNVMQEGTRTHQRLQASRGENYEKEVYLSIEIQIDDFELHIEGRCDGVYRNEKQVIIEEIKTTARDLNSVTEEDYKTYWAQLKMYAYIYCLKNGLDHITVHMVYAKRENEDEKTFEKHYELRELTMFVEEIAKEYLSFQKQLWKLKQARMESISKLKFPYDSYRTGQRDLAKAVYKTIREEKRVFAKAATGIGKTIATIFPSVISLQEGKQEKIMYLTAKTITKMVAEDSFRLLIENGLEIKVVTITAKEKICFQEETICQKEFCPFADGYYDRLKEGIKDILDNERLMDRKIIELYAKKHQLCPFEFSLDLAMFADVVICDYNYFFDPKVRLQRWGDFHKETILLIDEAHNLVDRSREMLSASLSKSVFLQVSREIKGLDRELYLKLKEVNDTLLKWKKELLKTNEFVLDDKPSLLIEVLEEAVEACEQWLLRNPSGMAHQEILEAYFAGQDFLRIAKVYNDLYKTIVTIYKSEVTVKLACMDSSAAIMDSTSKAVATVFFSATLHPLGYFQTVLGGEEHDYYISINTPFHQDQIKVYAKNISTKYQDRQNSIQPIAEAIREVFHSEKGNFLVFFPSYEYLSLVFEAYEKFAVEDSIETLVQQPVMTETERELFLDRFNPDREGTLLAFAVLGGIFSEGIDLKGNRLNGVGIIGVGLPRLSLERNVMKEHFQKQGQNGFDFAYVYPGMNKVQQAGGRLIRSEQDTGFLLLVDDRYFYPKYRELLPPEWQNFKRK
ncbi:ATP-dependent DNA helicase [Sutcliffiella horikoshii]|uniref:ATP-dependent DNA helicase n=1 Tax=Sutcliffiella horikoshii TaxID=79883 RepID=A0A5D4TGD4_9BACI|nr:ATP-dependent DNA helicase [Sutcliffiella horikoshii]TYS73592.1 ATP-dependent DNA helicase [Sutcliffiella horikoshii]